MSYGRDFADEFIERLPHTLEGLMGAHNDDKIIALLGKAGIIDTLEASRTLYAKSIGSVLLGEVIPEVVEVSFELEDQKHMSQVEKVCSRQDPEWRHSASLISSAIKNKLLDEQEIAETGKLSTIRIPSRSFTGSLLDLPAHLSLTREVGGDNLLVTISGLDHDGVNTAVAIKRDLTVPYYSGGWYDAVFMSKGKVRNAPDVGVFDRSEALHYILSEATK